MKVFRRSIKSDTSNTAYIEVKSTKKGITILEPDFSERTLTFEEAEILHYLLGAALAEPPTGPLKGTVLWKAKEMQTQGLSETQIAKEIGISVTELRGLLDINS